MFLVEILEVKNQVSRKVTLKKGLRKNIPGKENNKCGNLREHNSGNTNVLEKMLTITMIMKPLLHLGGN